MAKLSRSVEDVKRVLDAAYINSALVALLPSLASAARNRLAYRAETLPYLAGENILVEGEEPDGFHFIRRGTAEIFCRHEGIEEQIDSIRAGATIGEIAVLHPGRMRAATARAGIDCETVRFPLDVIRSFIESEREIREYLERQEQEFIIKAARRQHGRGTMMFIQKSGGKEATDLLLIDETLCVRCNNCAQACSETHGGVSRLNREAGATYMTSSGSALHLPTACQHCENPKCMTDCPPDALKRDPNGEVWINDETCIGGGNCEAYYPYDVIKMARVDHDPGPGLLMRLLFPRRARKDPGDSLDDVAAVKKAVKCDLCRDLPKKKTAPCVLLVSPHARRERSFGSIPASTSTRSTSGRAEAECRPDATNGNPNGSVPDRRFDLARVRESDGLRTLYLDITLAAGRIESIAGLHGSIGRVVERSGAFGELLKEDVAAVQAKFDMSARLLGHQINGSDCSSCAWIEEASVIDLI